MWNEILEGGLNQLIAKRLGMQVGSPTPAVSPELGVSLDLESDRIEWGYLKQELLGGARCAVGLVAGQFPFAALNNPAGSNSIITVTHLVALLGATNAFVKARALNVAGTLVTAGVRDTRWMPNGGTYRPTANLVFGNTAAAAPEPVLDYLIANVATSRLDGWVLKPGSSLYVEGEVVAIGMSSISFQWRERVAGPGELG